MKNLFSKTKVLSAAALLTFAISQQASAATIKFGHANNLNGVAQVATDGLGSGLTSVHVPSDNLTDGTAISPGFFVETFDQATQTLMPNSVIPFPTGSLLHNDTDMDFSTTCAVNGTGAGIKVTSSAGVGNGAFGVRSGKLPKAAAPPLDDKTCFGYTPQNKDLVDGNLEAWVEVNYDDFLVLNGDVGITFLGFYWGSVDDYNDFTFYDAVGDVIEHIEGSALLAAVGGVSGQQGTPESNVYVAIDFKLSEAFTKLRITSSGVAGEFDNIVIGLKNRPVDVPAPTGLALLGLGLIGLGLRRRLSK